MSYKSFSDLGVALEKLHITWVIHTKSPDIYKNFTQEFIQEHKFLPSSTFQELFHRGRSIYWNSAKRLEEMRKNRLIWPFLFEIEKSHPKLRIWEGVSLDADGSQDLTGEPDYSVCKENIIPTPPYCVIIEAKQEDFSGGWGQALAAMKGAQILNAGQSSQEISIYGVVTTGDEWQFGKLQKVQFAIYPKTTINVLETDDKVIQVLTLLDIIFSECEKEL